jgi:alpha,alpha-trehalase
VADIKVTETPVLYLPTDFSAPPAVANFPEQCHIRVEHLPFVITAPGQVKTNSIQPAGLLFLPNPYVVPGGRFNEMYGWDSYFIIRGLLRDGKIDLARGMVENFFFEIEHYGTVLNANRTYYLTRSQPPFLTSMITAVYAAEKSRGQASQTWLATAYQYAERDYQMWTRVPHLAGNTGLSRYYDFGEGPVAEGLHQEVGYYHDVLAYFLKNGQIGSPYVSESSKPNSIPYPQYSLQLCASANADSCDLLQYVALSPEYYKGDRAMRESGFDITFRFGPYGADTQHYAPVCLNSLLYKTEKDMEQISLWLGNKQAALQWRKRAQQRRRLIQTLFWNSQRGLYFDYDFQTHQQSSYVYATTFYPLWAGIATPAQARAVVQNLKLFEHQGGLAMSTRETGVQWDYPYGWAPIQLLAVEGLRRYGYNAEADRISSEFLAMVLANFQRDGTIREKYDVVSESSNIQLAEGYRSNVIGFGWTNAVFLVLLDHLPQASIRRLDALPN